MGKMTIKQIKEIDTCWDCNGQKYHESLLQAFQLLEKVTEMLRRGDSAETILEIISHIRGYDE
jgi:cytochrome c-type biogenesis protein CcmH/NrfF